MPLSAGPTIITNNIKNNHVIVLFCGIIKVVISQRDNLKMKKMKVLTRERKKKKDPTMVI